MGPQVPKLAQNMALNPQWTPSCPVCETFVAGIYRLYEESNRKNLKSKPASDPKVRHTVVKTLAGATKWVARKMVGKSAEVKIDSILWTYKGDQSIYKILADAEQCRWCVVLTRVNGKFDELMFVGVNDKGTMQMEFDCIRRQDVKGILGNVISLRPKDNVWDVTMHTQTRSDPLSRSNISKLVTAIDHCAQNHRRCPTMSQGESPLRLVNVLEGGHIRLEEMGRQTVTYAALSYCWGKSTINESNKTKIENVTRRLQPFPLSALPLTLQEAVQITRSMGIQYLWIDAFCIVQDSTEEWISEAGKMMEYYATAYVTIAPIMSSSADTGMLMQSNQRIYEGLTGPWSDRDGETLDLELQGRYDVSKSIEWSTWNSRGWTYQERLNSARVLYVLENRLILHCRKSTWDSSYRAWASEKNLTADFFPPSGPYFLPKYETSSITGKRNPNTDFDVWEGWNRIVSHYTKRQLTNPKDRFFAFSGIMETYRRVYNWEFVVGLRRHRLCEDLVSWNPWRPMSSMNLGGPSWTWLYTDWWSSRINHIPLWERAIEKLDASMAVEHIDDYNIPSAKLTISGLILRHDGLVHVLRHHHHTPWNGRGSPILTHLDYEHDKSLNFDCNCSFPQTSEFFQSDGLNISQRGIYCRDYHVISHRRPKICALFAGTSSFSLGYNEEIHEVVWHFLLVQPTYAVDKDGESAHFCRVGIMHVPESQIIDDTADIMAELRAQDRETIILV